MHIDAQVQLSFLMVGHTHEDIDQVFSKISTHLTSIYDMDGNYNVKMSILVHD